MAALWTDTPINGERYRACREFQCPPVPSGILMLSPANSSEVENTRQEEGRASMDESGEFWGWMSVLECQYFSNFVAQQLASLPLHNQLYDKK